MKLGLVTPRYPPTHAGGGEISVQLLAEHIRDRIEEVTVYSFDGNETETIGGVRIQRLTDIPQYPYSLANELAYRKLQSIRLDCDILHGYNMHLHPIVGRLSTVKEIPAVATLNAYPLLNWSQIGVNPSLQRWVYEATVLRLERPRLTRLMGHIDVFFPLSNAVKEVYLEHGFQNWEFKVVPNMLDPSFTVPTRNGSNSAEKRLLFVGYLRNSKGVRFLIDSMNLLPPEYVLTIIGDGPESEALERRANQSEASGRISFEGKIPYDEVTQSYASADVFVHPGVWPEPFGRTILEAMQAGLPVVATDIGGPSETIPQPELLCPPEDHRGLAHTIERAYKNREVVGAENERVVQETYHPKVVIPQIIETYRDVIRRY